MAGISAIGWWTPEGRLSAAELAQAHGLAEAAITKYGLVSRTAAGEDDHPSTMGARATRAALDAAGIATQDLDYLIFAGVTRDWPTPWVAAFGALHELGATNAGGFDLVNRCAAGIDALWLAKTLVDSGTHRTIAVCCAERYDHLIPPQRTPDLATDALCGAGAAAAVITPHAANEIVAYSHCTHTDLSVHRGNGPAAGGSRQPLTERALQAGEHFWQTPLSVGQVREIARFSAAADRYNYPRVLERAGFDAVDFVVCSPVDPPPQLEVLRELGIDPDATIHTIPFLGHLGPADHLLGLGLAVAAGRNVGSRIVLSVRGPVYANAVAIRGRNGGPGISVAGEGVDVDLWRTNSTSVTT